ncbi:hypothetical protein B7463_g1536, partial [Scytalidium lignicola]
MRNFLASFLALSSLADHVSNALTVKPRQELPLPVETLTHFNVTPTWLENIDVRSNGEVLATNIGEGILYGLTPSSGQLPRVVHSFLESNGLNTLLGIVEFSPDVFAVVVGNNSNLLPIADTFSLWRVDFHSNPTNVSKIADLTGAQLPNGLAVISENDELILVAESAFGEIWSVNVNTGVIATTVKVPEMYPVGAGAVPLEVNGIKVRDGQLYWTNTLLESLYRVQIDSQGYQKNGSQVHTVVQANYLIDDFTFDPLGNIWLMGNGNNTLLVVPEGSSSVIPVAGNNFSTILAGCSASHFGRTANDFYVLYATTTGGVYYPVNGTITEPGKIAAIDTRGYYA